MTYKRKEVIGDCTLYLGDCLEIMPLLSNIECVLTDPPYNNIVSNEWDNQWKTMADFQNWCLEVGKQIYKISSDNMSLFWFGDDKNIAYVQVVLDKIFNMLNHFVWHKINDQRIKSVFQARGFQPVTERALFYDKGEGKSGLEMIYSNVDCFYSIKKYMREEKQKIKDKLGFKTEKQFNEYINKVTETASVVSRHYFADSQYSFPTPELYKKLQNTGFFKREYEDLRREYEDLRRPWIPDNKSFDVVRWGICQDADRSHPTQKPLELIQWLLYRMSKQGQVILDPFMGSGTTLVACAKMKRKGIGIELDEGYFDIACKRVEDAYKQDDLFY